MGKRELLLIVGFIILGTVLYRVTAPATPKDGGFSLRTMVDSVRREIGSHEEYLGDEREVALDIGSHVSEVRIAHVHGLRVRGTDASRAQLHVNVYSTGLSEEEARGFARRVSLQERRSGDILALDFDYPPEARQRTELTIEVPSRLRMRVERVRGGVNLEGVAGIELDETGGEVRLVNVNGPIRGSHAGGELIIENARDVDLTTRRADVTLAGVSGRVRLDMSGGGLAARGVKGSVRLDANRASIELKDVSGPIEADITQGQIEASGLAESVRIDGRGTDIQLDLARPVPVTAFTTDENVEVRLPAQGGFTLDLTVEDGEIRLPDGAPTPTTLEQTRRATGDYRGGGPSLSLRTSHADVIVR
jgi:hypothetical protein